MTLTKEGLNHAGYAITHIESYYYVSWVVDGVRCRIQEDGKDKRFRCKERAHAFLERHARKQQHIAFFGVEEDD